MTTSSRHLLYYLFIPCIAVLLYNFLYTPVQRPTNSMPAHISAQEAATALLVGEGLQLKSLERIQSLWAGYGEICRVTAVRNSPSTASSNGPQSYVLKLVTPPPTKADDEGHTRKILSYRAEQYFYTHLAPQMPAFLPVAKCVASINKQNSDGTSITAMLLSDLKQKYPVAGEKRAVLTRTQVFAALDWLSGFHGFWWSRVSSLTPSSLVLPPLEEVQREDKDAGKKSVWLNGGYTYLATRRQEYSSLAMDHHSEWSIPLTRRVDNQELSIAELAAAFLAPQTSQSTPIQKYQTLIHGDVKSENLFTSTSGEEVAFYDFQYTGLGLGVCDLAKYFTCSVPLAMLVDDEQQIPQKLAMQHGEEQLLRRYWQRLCEIGGQQYDWDTFVRHWEIALVDWLRFQASWGFWGNTEWLEARVRSVLGDEEWRRFLIDNVSKRNVM
jgi:hypothetical protein